MSHWTEMGEMRQAVLDLQDSALVFSDHVLVPAKDWNIFVRRFASLGTARKVQSDTSRPTTGAASKAVGPQRQRGKRT